MRYFLYVVVVWAALFAVMAPLQAAPEHIHEDVDLPAQDLSGLVRKGNT